MRLVAGRLVGSDGLIVGPMGRLRFGCFGRAQPYQAGLRANIRFIFQAMVTRLYSPRAFSSPRIENRRNPSTDLMMPNTGSGVCLRRA
jgi:hypothetical protein